MAVEIEACSFVNERGNRIEITAERGPARDEITYSMVGPTSAATNTITRREAAALRDLLSHFLKEET